MAGTPVWRITTVHNRDGNVFCRRIERTYPDRVDSEVPGADECEKMRGLATAIKMLAEDMSCRRVMVPVGVDSVQRDGIHFGDALMGIALEVRSKIVIELRQIGAAIPRSCVEFAKAMQMQANVPVATWVSCDRTEFVTGVVDGLSPAVLGIEAQSLRLAMSQGDRSSYIDAVEVAELGGAMVMADGVDCIDDLKSVAEIGVELVAGRLWRKTSFVEEAKGSGAPRVRRCMNWR